MNSKDVSNLKSNLFSQFTIPLRDLAYNDIDNGNLEAFYALKPKFSKDSDEIPRSKEISAFREINNILQQAIEGKLTIDEVIEKLQEDVTNAMQTTK